MKLTRYAFALFLLFGLLETAPADPWYVATNGPGGGATSWETAASNIQDAISLCSSGDVVWVSNGVYETGGIDWPAGTGQTNRVAITTAYITVRSANNDPAATIIRGKWDPGTDIGPEAVRCVYMATDTSLIGFSLEDGATLAANEGGGVYCPSTGAFISNCWIIGNMAANGGGARNSTFYNSRFIGNTCTNLGGGTYGSYLYDCELIANVAAISGGGASGSRLINCTVTSNRADGTLTHGGGGANSCTSSNCVFRGNTGRYGGAIMGGSGYNCLFIGNHAGQYGGVGYNASFYNCTMVGNYANVGGAIRLCNLYNCIAYSNKSSNALYDNIYANSEKATLYSCSFPTQAEWVVGDGNITNPPALIDYGTGFGTNHVAGDYRLQAVSPCINTGSNGSWTATSFDLDWHSRVDKFSGQADMGCYEYISKGALFGAY